MEFEKLMDYVFPNHYQPYIGKMIKGSLIVCGRCEKVLKCMEYMDNGMGPLCATCFLGCYECKTENYIYKCSGCLRLTCGCLQNNRGDIQCDNCHMPYEEEEQTDNEGDLSEDLGDYDYRKYDDDDDYDSDK